MPHQNTHPVLHAPSEVEDAVLDTSTVVASLTVSADGLVLGANGVLKALLELRRDADLRGRPLTEILAGKNAWSHWQDALNRGRCRGVEIELRSRNGRTVALRGDITRFGGEENATLRGVFVDTMAERQSQQALQRSARLEALASLTSGVAHDFNNLLTVLVGNLSLVAEELRDRTEIFAKLKASRDAAKRGSDLIRQLLGFARSGEVQTGVIDPAKIAENLLPLLSRALGSRITIHTEFPAQSCTLRANVAQLESVIVNLAVNAKDAIDSTGKVIISLANVHLSPAETAAQGLAAGNYVRLAVSDDGRGIPPGALDRVFTPFFTTKSDKGGTGLGLSMVREFASQAGGSVSIESEVGKGTSVILLLPHCSEHLDETSVKTMPLSALPTGDERVVVVSNDEGLRATVRQILEALGYTVRLCTDVDELMAALGSDCDLLVSDGPIVDACRNDPRVVQALAARRGLRRVVLSSGGRASAEPSPGAQEAVLLKPFSLADLAEMVRKTLDGRR